MNKRIAVAVFGLMLAGSAMAQFHGVPAGATSIGGNHSMDNPPGVPAGATSLGPHGFTANHRPPFFPMPVLTLNPHHSRRVLIAVPVPLFGYGYYPYLPAYGYSSGPVIAPADYREEEPPTSELMPPPVVVQPVQQPPPVIVIDNRGVRDATDEEKTEAIATSKAKKAKQEEPKPAVKAEAEDVGPMTLIIFRDGTRKEVKNYAIMGKELIVLGQGSLRRILLADIDLKATQQENDVRGLDFRLP